MDATIKDRLRFCPRLPTLPSVAIELVTKVRDPDIELTAITQLIANDPALSAKMLRVANSSLYRQYRQIQNLKQAVRLLGINATVTLSLNFSLAACLRDYRTPGIDLDYFWRRALISAMAARLLGQNCRIHTLDELFLAALLQDIGRLALDAALPERYAATQGSGGHHDPSLGYERDALAVDHVEAGAWLVEEWRLPDYLSLAIWASHDCARRRDVQSELRWFIGCIATSGRIADIVLVDDADHATTVAQQVASACLDIAPYTLGTLLGQLVETLPVVEALFETPVITAAQAEGVTEKAQELIACYNLRQLQDVADRPKSDDEFKQMVDHLYSVAHRDALTGLFNRRHFDEVFDAAFAEAGGKRHPLSLAYVDLDYFKIINDQHGHLAGDMVLKKVAETIQSYIRTQDLMARYGGEEFVILLPGHDRAAAFRVIERIRCGVKALDLRPEGKRRVSITLSAGVATYSSEEGSYTSADLMKSADRALYQAKESGRNKVVLENYTLRQTLN